MAVLIKGMNTIVRSATAFLLLAALGAGEAAWSTDVPAASAAAAKEKKAILLDFTGSDWCGWCVKLKKEVFDTPEFATWAKDKVILVEIDFPRGKSQPAKVKKQNDELSNKFKIDGFPTIVLVDAKGNELGRLGYVPGGPAKWIAEADRVLAAKR
jgi:protein disulfide-isomerase